MADTRRLIATLAEEVAAHTRAPHPFTLSLKWLAVSLLYMGLLLTFFGPREDLASRWQDGFFMMEVVVLALLVITASASAALLSFPDGYQKPLLLWLPVIPAILFVAVLYSAWLNDNPPAPTPVHGLECLLCILAFAFFPAVWMMYQLRKQAGVHPYITGGIALLAAVGMGCLALRLSEPVDSISHLVGWHYIPMLVAALMGLWLGRIFLKW